MTGLLHKFSKVVGEAVGFPLSDADRATVTHRSTFDTNQPGTDTALRQQKFLSPSTSAVRCTHVVGGGLDDSNKLWPVEGWRPVWQRAATSAR